MIFPTLFPATACRRADRGAAVRRGAGIPAVLYIKDANYITPEAAAELVDEGIISWIKYAIVRDEPVGR